MPKLGTFLKPPRSTQHATLTFSNYGGMLRTLSVAIQSGAYLTLRVLVEMSGCTGDHICICPFRAPEVFWMAIPNKMTKMNYVWIGPTT
jgi:hypothetical protein